VIELVVGILMGIYSLILGFVCQQKQKETEKLKKENSDLKYKLSQKKAYGHIFTIKEIKEMDLETFAENEKNIFNQLVKGLIK